MSTSLWFDNPREFIRNELRNFFRDTATGWGRSGGGWPRARQRSGVFPPVNIYDDGEGFRIRAEMPGVDPDSLDVSAKADQLVLRGERNLQEAGEDANYHRREREGGSFRRAVRLPEPIDADGVYAKYSQGILDVFAPRSEEARPRKIEVK